MIYSTGEKFVLLNEKSGVIQNPSTYATAEFATGDKVPEVNTGIHIAPGEKFTFSITESNKNAYVRFLGLRDEDENPYVAVVNFNFGASTTGNGSSTDVKHGDLSGRDLSDQHPITAITGLKELLDTLITTADAKAYADTKISNLINGAPEAFDTLKEIADVLSNDENSIAAILNALAKKVDKVAGKDLSTNDYTNADKEKLDKFSEDDDGNFIYKGKTITGEPRSELKQITKLGVTGKTTLEISLNAADFKLPPVEILKFAPADNSSDGNKNQRTLFDFSATDGEKFTVDDVSAEQDSYIALDGTVHLKTDYEYRMLKITTFTGEGQYSEDSNIDDTIFKIIEEGVVE